MPNKNIDHIINEKANAYQPDTSFMAKDWAQVKASLPTGPATPSVLPKANPNWFSLNTIIGTILVTVVSIITIYVVTKKDTKKPSTNNDMVKNAIPNNTTTSTSIADTPVIVNEIPKDPTKGPKKWVYKMKLNFEGKTNTTLPAKKFIDLNDVKDEDNETKKKQDIINNKIVIQNFISQLASPKQVFTINNQQAHNITCTNGTKLIIKPNTFTSINKKTIQGNIELEIKEAYSYTDIIANNLHTVSNGSLLQSGGMVYINATQNMQQLDIDIQNPIQLQMPTSNKKDIMQLFNLDKGNWVPNGQWQGERQLLTYDNIINNNEILKNEIEPKFEREKWSNTKEGDFKNTTLAQSLEKQNASSNIDTIPRILSSLMNQESITKSILCNPTTVVTQNGKKIAVFKFSGHVSESFSELRMIAMRQFQGQFDSVIIKKATTQVSLNLDFESIKNYNQRLEDGMYYNTYQLQNGKFIVEDSTYCSIGYFQKFNPSLILNGLSFNDLNRPVDSLGNVNFKSKDTNGLYYNFSIRNFGWINCDRFYEKKDLLQNFYVQNITINQLQTKYSVLLFPKIKSVLNGVVLKGEIDFRNIPNKTEVVFLGIKIEYNKLLTCIQNFTTSKEAAKAEDFIELTPAQVKAKLDALGSVR